MSQQSNLGLFIGLVTIDFIYLAKSVPRSNQKIVATDYTVAAGGPATNAAVTFSYWNQAKLLGVVGSHPLRNLIVADLETYQVTVQDLEPTQVEPPPVSSIIVTEATGERAIVSINAVKTQVTGDRLPEDILQGVNIVLIDGHQMAVGHAIARQARKNNIPVVIDGGSWKPGFEKVLPFVDYAVCSTNFYPPGCNNTAEVFAYLTDIGIPYIAITQGENPIQYQANGKHNRITVPKVKAVDTLGAGDIFHGTFCHYILQASFPEALAAAACVAANSCQFFGTRRWMQQLSHNHGKQYPNR
ncbi:sugar kinase [Gloeocapsopsis dulcis]|uniref:Ribokinase n=1 Tax=Gloeocapsopsis dulcis AAB1 = 1H9 TaxID=1433147 RepID=A0A6N8G3Z0_9CHRO|nr:sugar kinase [Gloeocapsopsis dulcis]MUL38907.1 ribokinase [Gloeocapsopsis dulcis AAB1 = 1H9]WNN88013.1 sugar kinase [Gloeocapsopsis dulcis]